MFVLNTLAMVPNLTWGDRFPNKGFPRVLMVRDEACKMLMWSRAFHVESFVLHVPAPLCPDNILWVFTLARLSSLTRIKDRRNHVSPAHRTRPDRFLHALTGDVISVIATVPFRYACFCVATLSGDRIKFDWLAKRRGPSCILVVP